MLGFMQVPGGEEVLGLSTEAVCHLLADQQPLTHQKQPEGVLVREGCICTAQCPSLLTV